MKTLIASLVIVAFALAFAPHPAAHADGVCTAPSPSFTGKLPGNGTGVVLYVPRYTYITAVCVTINGSTFTLIQGGVLTAIPNQSPNCRLWLYKAFPPTAGGSYAFVSQGYPYTPAACPSFRITLRTVKSVG